MDKPGNIESVWPHTEMILFLIDSDTCFGEPVDNVMEEVLDCEHIKEDGYHNDNGLTANAHQLPRAKIEQDEEIIPHSLLLMDCDLIIDTKIKDYIKGTTIPSATRIVAIIDQPQHSNPEEQLDIIKGPIERASTKQELMDQAEDYFRTICPECNGESARAWVHRWCEGVFHRVHN